MGMSSTGSSSSDVGVVDNGSAISLETRLEALDVVPVSTEERGAGLSDSPAKGPAMS